MSIDYEFEVGEEIRFKPMFGKEWTYGTVKSRGYEHTRLCGVDCQTVIYSIYVGSGKLREVDVFTTIERASVLDRLARL